MNERVISPGGLRDYLLGKKTSGGLRVAEAFIQAEQGEVGVTLPPMVLAAVADELSETLDRAKVAEALLKVALLDGVSISEKDTLLAVIDRFGKEQGIFSEIYVQVVGENS